MLNNQAALYRVNKLTPGKDLWHKSYEEVHQQSHFPICTAHSSVSANGMSVR